MKKRQNSENRMWKSGKGEVKWRKNSETGVEREERELKGELEKWNGSGEIGKGIRGRVRSVKYTRWRGGKEIEGRIRARK